MSGGVSGTCAIMWAFSALDFGEWVGLGPSFCSSNSRIWAASFWGKELGDIGCNPARTWVVQPVYTLELSHLFPAFSLPHRWRNSRICAIYSQRGVTTRYEQPQYTLNMPFEWGNLWLSNIFFGTLFAKKPKPSQNTSWNWWKVHLKMRRTHSKYIMVQLVMVAQCVNILYIVISGSSEQFVACSSTFRHRPCHWKVMTQRGQKLCIAPIVINHDQSDIWSIISNP